MEEVFNFEAVFDVDDYMYFYGDKLTDEISDWQVESLVNLLMLDQPMKILDLACGFGRHANRLAALGHQVTGIDLTPGFLAIARRDAESRGVLVDYLEGDMRQIKYADSFDRVLLLFTAFGYYEDHENFLVLKNINKALKPGGLFIFDIQNRDSFLKIMDPFHVTEKDGDLMIDRHTFDTLSGRLYNRRIVFRDNLRKDKPFFIRLYNPSEIQSLLEQANLVVHAMYGGWDGKEITTDSTRMVIIARK